jgi:hypothetical protein
MKLKYLVLFLLFFTAKLSYTEELSFYHYGFQENSETYLFGDKVRVRKAPAVKDDNIIDILNTGVKVRIIKKTDKVMTADGYKEYWYKISYKKNNKNSDGYVWGGLLSIGYSAIGEKLFLTGLKKYSTGNGFFAECRFVEKGKTLASVSFDPHYMNYGSDEGFYGYSVSTELMGNMGLEGIEGIHRIFFNYEACGYPRGNVWIGYNKDKLYYIGKDTSVSEAGVFHAEERYIFPSENKKSKDKVILISESFEFDESTSDYKLTERRETEFIWKDYKLIPLK